MLERTSKAQSQIVSAMLMVVIAISLVSTAYIWGAPLIQKQQDTAVVERLYETFNPTNSNSLARRMQYILNAGGEEIFTVDAGGSWQLFAYNAVTPENNSLQFSVLTRVSNFANFSNVGWISLTQGTDCNNILSGRLGLDTSYVVCVKSETRPENRFLITYKTTFRELNDTNTNNIFKVELVPESTTTVSSFKSIKILRDQTSSQGNTITTKLKVLLQ